MKIPRKPTYKLSLSRLLFPVLLAVACMAQRGLSDEQASGGPDSAKNSTISVARDPFWPVGYTPEWLTKTGKIEEVAAVEGNGNEDWNTAMKQVVINGVSSRAGNEFFAVINGQVKTVGETVSVTLDSSTYSWAVEGITPPSSVKLRRVSVK